MLLALFMLSILFVFVVTVNVAIVAITIIERVLVNEIMVTIYYFILFTASWFFVKKKILEQYKISPS